LLIQSFVARFPGPAPATLPPRESAIRARLETLNRLLLVIPAQAGIQFFEHIAEESEPSLRQARAWDDG
jgi:hypothetical protein